MTIAEVIAEVDELAPNQYSETQKLRWLSDLDGRVWDQITGPLTGGRHSEIYFPEEGYTDTAQELLIGQPYARDVYTYFLMSQICAMNAEITKYNQYGTLYNSAIDQYEKSLLRQRRRSPAKAWRF